MWVWVASIPLRVVWRLRDTAEIVVLVSLLSICDFPAFGAPTIATSSLFLGKFRGGGGDDNDDDALLLLLLLYLHDCSRKEE